MSNTGSKLCEFIITAKSHIGEGGEWAWKTMGTGAIEWCAAFVSSCAKTVGILDVIIPSSCSCTYIATTGTEKQMGRFLKGPNQGINIKPQVGDLILFRWDSYYTSIYDSDHIGIVTEVVGDTVNTVEGNTGGYDKYTSSVKANEYKYTYNCINGYYRPDWSKVGAGAGDMPVGGGGYIIGSLYNTQNTREDGTIREVCYLNSDYKPSILKSDIKLSVVNYTSMISSLFSNFVISTDCDVILDGVDNPNARTIIQYLLNKGLNAAAAVGICGNIYHESGGYRTDAVGDLNTSFGICQWHLGRGVAMKKMAGENWATNLSGQLDYLWYELTTSYTNVLNALKNIPNSEEGVKTAADIFVRKFEVPADVEHQSSIRQSTALELWSQLVIQQSSGFVNTSISTQSGQSVSDGESVTIPDWVNQSGITQNYTNYTYFFPIWAKSSIQYKLSRIWDEQGRPSNRNIATINGYYLCAVTLTFGTTGDLITVILEDGTSFNAIIADSKGSNPGTSGESGNQYGHAFGNGKIDVIEWEKKGTSSSSTDNNTQIDLAGWKGKRVSKIINHGSFLR